jgi:putrescine transport system permease protein
MIRPLVTRLFDRMHAHPLFRAHSRKAVISLPFVWLLVFMLLPFFIILKISFSEVEGVKFLALSQYKDGVFSLALNLSHYLFILEDRLYLVTYLNSVWCAFLTTIWCLFIGYPFAYFMARAKATVQPALLMLVMLPFWSSYLLRVYAWKGLLMTGGLLSKILIALHVDWLLLKLGYIAAPGMFMNTKFAMLIGMVYTYLPFMILPLYATLSKMDVRYLEAAADLGATPWVGFWKITVPLSKAGIIAGSMLVFIPCIGEFVIPEMLGGPETLMIGRVLYEEFFGNFDWPMASAVAVVVILLILLPLAVFNKYQAEATEVRP